MNLLGLACILADISLTHPFIGNAADMDQWGTYQGKKLSQRAQIKSLGGKCARRRAFCFGHAVGIWALRAMKGNSDGGGNSDVAGT